MDIDLKELGLGAFTIYRPNGSPISVTGNASVEVKDGSLIIYNGSTVVLILSPGRWLSVNVDPTED